MLLNLYIRKQTIKSIGSVLMVLAVLNIFIYLSLQLANNKGLNMQTITYAVFLTPRNLYRALTVMVLISGALVLYRMQETKEWLIMSSFGMSHRRLFANVILIELFFIIIMAYLGETIAIDLERFAKQKGTYVASNGQISWNFNNLWFKERDAFIHVGGVLNDKKLKIVDQFLFKGNHLVKYIHAKGARFVKAGEWELLQVSVYDPNQLGIKDVKDRATWKTGLHPSVLAAASVTGTRLSLHKLFWAIWNSKNLGILSDDMFTDFIQRVTKPIISITALCCVAPLLLRCHPRGFQNYEIIRLVLVIMALVALQQEVPIQFQSYLIMIQMCTVILGVSCAVMLDRIR